ncbi:MAG TPA: FliH/SctL family protein [Bacteroidota bacterium]|nr:FliH/SctL family protein [Bacteroidota bacterium]
MYRESKILTINSIYNVHENSLQKRAEEVYKELEKVNNYLKDFKNGVCDKILQLAIELIEKLRSVKVSISDEVLGIIIENMKGIFRNDKIIVYLNPKDEKILNTYMANSYNYLQELEILTNDYIEPGECKFDYDFLKIKLRILHYLDRSKDTIIKYYDSIEISSNETPNKSTNKDKQKKDKKNQFDNELENYETKKLIQLLMNEDPKTIAVILVNINPIKTAEILWQLPYDLRYDVINQISMIGKIPKDVVDSMFNAVKNVLENNLLDKIEIKRKRYNRDIFENNNLYLIAKRKY